MTRFEASLERSDTRLRRRLDHRRAAASHRRAARLGEILLELYRAVLRGVLGEHTPPCPAADRAALALRHVEQIVNRLACRLADQNFGSGLKQRVEPLPAVADDRHAAGRRLEQP